MIPEIELKYCDIPVLGLGTWNLTGEQCLKTVKDAINLGYRHIDTAELYGNQPIIGNAIKDTRREELFLTSKVWTSNLNYNSVIRSCENTLDELHTEYIDLLLIHWPNKNIPIDETISAFEHLQKEGKIKSFGVSNFSISHLKKVLKHSAIEVNQVEMHPYLYQEDLIKFCKDNNIKITAYCPLAQGKVAQDDTIIDIARKYNKTASQVALRWLVQLGFIVIPKSTDIDHLSENMKIFDFELIDQDMESLEKLPQKRILNPPFADFD